MKLVAVMPVRNEDWVLGLSLRAVLMWCDAAVVLNHCSTDKTAAILAEIAKETGRVQIIEEHDPVWREMAHRQRLLETARSAGATHIATIDADEVLTGNLLPRIRRWIEELTPAGVLVTPLPCLWGSIDQYRSDPSAFGIQFQQRCCVAFRDDRKVCWRTHKGYDHHARAPFGSRIAAIPVRGRDGGLMHLQFVSRRRLVAKHALYKVNERLRWPDRDVRLIDCLYSMAPDETGLRTAPVPLDWWRPYLELLRYLHVDREPWQEAEVRRLVAEHGRSKFAGLNLFGVA